jgi:predicted nucleotidyltransferase
MIIILHVRFKFWIFSILDKAGRQIYTSFMTKQEIKTKLLEAVKSSDHRNDIKSVAIFGSFVTGAATDTSDVDVLIDFEPAAKVGLLEFVRIQRHLAEAVGRKVDLLTPEAISKYIRNEIMRQSELVYAR